jgi:hypothetical protein
MFALAISQLQYSGFYSAKFAASLDRIELSLMKFFLVYFTWSISDDLTLSATGCLIG